MRQYKINIFVEDGTIRMKFRSLEEHLEREGFRIGWSQCGGSIGQYIIHTPLNIEEVRGKLLPFDLNYTLSHCH